MRYVRVEQYGTHFIFLKYQNTTTQCKRYGILPCSKGLFLRRAVYATSTTWYLVPGTAVVSCFSTTCWDTVLVLCFLPTRIYIVLGIIPGTRYVLYHGGILYAFLMFVPDDPVAGKDTKHHSKQPPPNQSNFRTRLNSTGFDRTAAATRPSFSALV